MLVSIVIPTFNKNILLRSILLSLQQQTHKGFEVIVVDDGSSDNTIEDLRGFEVSYPLRVFETGLTDVFGMCTAINIGIARARGELVFLLNDDIYLHGSCIEHHILAHKKTKHKYTFIGPRLQCPPYKFGSFVRNKDLRRKMLRKHTMSDKIRGFHTYRRKLMASSNISVATSTLREIGGYNEGFTRYCGNIDRELYDRLNRVAPILFLYRAQAYAVRYSNELYKQTEWLRNSNLRGGLGVVEWKHRQSSRSLRALQEARKKKPTRIEYINEDSIVS